MARIAGIEINDNLKVDYGLTLVKGIGWARSVEVLKTLKISSDKRIKDLSTVDISKIATALGNYDIEGELDRKIRQNVTRLKDIGSYRGSRHKAGLPTRGQRTKTNARTKRGKRKTVGAFRKEALSKMQQAKT